MGLTVSNVHVDLSLLSDEVSDFRSPPYANSFVSAFRKIREMVPFGAPLTLFTESWAFSCSSLVWPLFAAVET